MTLQHIQQIMLEMAQDDSTLKTAFEQLNEKAIAFPQNSIIVSPILRDGGNVPTRRNRD